MITPKPYVSSVITTVLPSGRISTYSAAVDITFFCPLNLALSIVYQTISPSKSIRIVTPLQSLRGSFLQLFVILLNRSNSKYEAVSIEWNYLRRPHAITPFYTLTARSNVPNMTAGSVPNFSYSETFGVDDCFGRFG